MKQAGARPQRNLLTYVRSLNLLLRASAEPLPAFSRRVTGSVKGDSKKQWLVCCDLNYARERQQPRPGWWGGTEADTLEFRGRSHGICMSCRPNE